MNKEIDPEMKLSEIYKNLCGVPLTIEDMDLPVRVYNHLKRSGIQNLEQILCMSENDFINVSRHVKFGRGPESWAYIIFKLEALSNQY